jgi:hypothetical protein
LEHVTHPVRLRTLTVPAAFAAMLDVGCWRPVARIRPSDGELTSQQGPGAEAVGMAARRVKLK